MAVKNTIGELEDYMKVLKRAFESTGTSAIPNDFCTCRRCPYCGKVIAPSFHPYWVYYQNTGGCCAKSS